MFPGCIPENADERSSDSIEEAVQNVCPLSASHNSYSHQRPSNHPRVQYRRDSLQDRAAHTPSATNNHDTPKACHDVTLPNNCSSRNQHMHSSHLSPNYTNGNFVIAHMTADTNRKRAHEMMESYPDFKDERKRTSPIFFDTHQCGESGEDSGRVLREVLTGVRQYQDPISGYNQSPYSNDVIALNNEKMMSKVNNKVQVIKSATAVTNCNASTRVVSNGITNQEPATKSLDSFAQFIQPHRQKVISTAPTLLTNHCQNSYCLPSSAGQKAASNGAISQVCPNDCPIQSNHKTKYHMMSSGAECKAEENGVCGKKGGTHDCHWFNFLRSGAAGPGSGFWVFSLLLLKVFFFKLCGIGCLLNLTLQIMQKLG